MSYETNTSAPKGLARWAGFLYLVIIVAGVTGEGLIRSGAIVSGDAAATSGNILASGGVFFLSIGMDIVMVAADIALAVLLLTLFRPVNGTLSAMAAAFRLTQAGTIAVSLLALWAGTVLVYCDPAAIGAAREQIDILALGLIEMHGVGYGLGLVFFGINCLVTGYLIVRSGFVPKAIGWLMAAAGGVYLIGSTTELFVPSGVEAVSYLYAIPLIAEASMCLWLLVKGINADNWRRQVEVVA